jgi:hypothetical protein
MSVCQRPQRSVEELRADLSYVLTGMLHQRELKACVKAVRMEPELVKDKSLHHAQPFRQRSQTIVLGSAPN